MGDRLRVGISSRYVTSQLGQLSFASLRGRLIEYQLRLGGKGGNITSVVWQVTLCNPIWHVSSRSGVATLRTANLLLTYLQRGQISSIAVGKGGGAKHPHQNILWLTNTEQFDRRATISYRNKPLLFWLLTLGIGYYAAFYFQAPPKKNQGHTEAMRFSPDCFI